MAESFATLQGAAVLDGTITLPCEGPWFARLRVATTTVPRGSVALVLGDLTLRGVVSEGGAPYGRLDALLIGGAGRLGATIEPADFRNTPARIPLEAALQAGGETLAASADAGLLGRFLLSWTRPRTTVGAAVRALARAIGGRWRVLADGGVWVGVDAGALSAAKGTRLDEWPDRRARAYALERFALFPGQTFDGRPVGDVQHTLTASSVRTVAWPP